MMEREYRDLSFVRRWSIGRVLRPQTVAEHSYYVTLYALEIAMFMRWTGDTAALMRHALVHDLDEVLTGDIPGPAKRKIVASRAQYYNVVRSSISEMFPSWVLGAIVDGDGDDNSLGAIMKVANLVDECLYLSTEMQMGNGAVGSLYENSHSRLRDAVVALEKFGDEFALGDKIDVGMRGTQYRKTNELWATVERAITSHHTGQSRFIRD